MCRIYKKVRHCYKIVYLYETWPKFIQATIISRRASHMGKYSVFTGRINNRLKVASILWPLLYDFFSITRLASLVLAYYVAYNMAVLLWHTTWLYMAYLFSGAGEKIFLLLRDIGSHFALRGLGFSFSINSVNIYSCKCL